MGKHRDFLLLKLVNGQISFSVDLGTGNENFVRIAARLGAAMISLLERFSSLMEGRQNGPGIWWRVNHVI